MRRRALILAATAMAVAMMAGASGWSKLDNRPLPRLDAARLLSQPGLRFAADEGPVALPPKVAAELVNGLTSNGLEAILSAIKVGFKPVEKQAQPTYAVALGGYSGFIVLNDRVGEGNTYTALQFYATFHPTQKPALETVNSWNRTKRFCRAWLEDQETAALAQDLDLERGVTKGTVEQALWIFAASTQRFADLLEPR